MNIKPKAFGAVVLVAMLLNSLGAASASATTGGHFTSASAHTTLSGSEGGEHSTELSFHGLAGTIECLGTSYSGTTSSSTVTEVTVTPSYNTCQTTGGTHGAVSVAMNGCDYVLKIGKLRNEGNTVSLACPSEKAIVISHPNCTITVLAQSMTGVVYATTVENGRHTLTVEVSLTFSTQYHGGLCVFTGTNHTATLKGSITVKGVNAEGAQVGITATGSEDLAQEFRSEASHTALTGTQTTSSKTTFGTLLGSVECTGTLLDGTTAATKVGEITAKPTYTGCTGSGREVTTHTNGCAYVLTGAEDGVSGIVHIECPAGKAIETTIDKFPEGCTLTIGAQVVGGVVDHKEEGVGSGRDLLLTWTLEGLAYERDGCEVGGKGNNGTMTGSITLSGEDTSGNPKGIWIE
ncbi:MAG TPA: hypothetical protein VF729_10530 [Solirubrobacterales bacterium]